MFLYCFCVFLVSMSDPADSLDIDLLVKVSSGNAAGEDFLTGLLQLGVHLSDDFITLAPGVSEHCHDIFDKVKSLSSLWCDMIHIFSSLRITT